MPQHKAARFALSGRWVISIATGLLLLAGVAGFLTYKFQVDPTFIWLSPQNGAEWIRLDRPTWLGTHSSIQNRITEFRTILVVDETVPNATLTFRALKRAAVQWDGQSLYAPRQSGGPKNWKQDRLVPLPGPISQGRHELRIAVENADGPPALLAYCKPLDLSTGRDWQARRGKGSWSAVFMPGQYRPVRVTYQFPTAHTTLIRLLPLFLVVICLFSGAAWGAKRLPLKFSNAKWLSSAGTLRWLLLVAWAVLAVNNNAKLPLKLGFDSEEHMKYVRYIINMKTLPLADNGWQMFQSPLYYLITALAYSVLSLVWEQMTVERLCRFIPLMCGLMQVELCFRGLRYMFPKRNDLQCLGLLLGGLLPMNLYISQTFSNEPMAGVFSAAAVVLLFRFLRDPDAARSSWPQAGLGLLLGLAILTKVTPVLLVPPAMLLLVYILRQAGCRFVDIAAACTRVLVTCALVAGWYYLRNWIEFGSPFVGGWDPRRGIYWWQDPGYRSLEQLTAFGLSLDRPFYAALEGFWDGIYCSFWLDGYLSARIYYWARPPWNEAFLVPAAWLALVPTFAIVLGAARAVRIPDKATRAGLLFSVATVGFYFSAMLYLWLKVPVYGCAKATYTLGLIPCYAALGAAGFDWLARHRLLRPIVYGYMTSWALCAYLAYFVVQEIPDPFASSGQSRQVQEVERDADLVGRYNANSR